MIKKHGVFILIGFLVGLAMGGSIVFWKHAVLKNLVFNNKAIQYVNSFFDKAINEEDNSLDNSSKENLSTHKTSKNIITKKNEDSTNLSYDNKFSINPNDTTSLEDTLLYADFSYDASTQWEFNKDASEIVVMRDRLIFAKQFIAKSNQNNQNERKDNLDSLLIGGKQIKTIHNEFTVEFWESPINYKGYKRNKNKILLYGINQFENIALYVHNNGLFLKHNNVYFPIENNSFFQNFIPVDNQQLISQLEQL